MQAKAHENLSQKERVVITGNAGSLGRALVLELLKNPKLDLIGVDRRPLENIPEGLTHLPLDLRRKSAFESIKKLAPQSIIHLGVIRNPQLHRMRRANTYYFNLESTAQLLRLAEKLSIRKFVFLSTANLYGPSAQSQGLLNEDRPLHGADKSPEFRDLVTIDMMVQSFFWKKPQTQTIILRPCHIVGPGLRNAPTRYFSLDRIPTILGFDPMIQLVHLSDLLRAISLSLRSDVRGIFNIAGKDAAPLSRIIRALERPSLPLPERLLKALAAGSFFSRRSPFPANELDHLKYSCLIDDSRARHDLAFAPKKGLLSIIKELKQEFTKAKEEKV
jgi:UDP-glucose 4-epimerase